MIRRPPRATRTDTLFPYTTLFRSALADLVRQLPFILDADLRIGRVIGAETVGQAGHLARLFLYGHASDQVVHALHLARREGAAGQREREEAGKGSGQDGAAVDAHQGKCSRCRMNRTYPVDACKQPAERWAEP